MPASDSSIFSVDGTIVSRMPLRDDLTVRLSTLLASTGYFTRKSLKKARPLVNGSPSATDLRLIFKEGQTHRIELFEEEFIVQADEALLLAMHKPVGIVTARLSHESDSADLSVYDLLPSWLQSEHLEAIGRLDKDTSGLLLFTEDGALNQRIRHPSRQVERRYLATLARPLDPSVAQNALTEGVTLRDGATVRPLRLEASDASQLVWNVTVVEGKYHEVRRLFAALGNHVEALHRKGYHRCQLIGTELQTPGNTDNPIPVLSELPEDQDQMLLEASLTRISGEALQSILQPLHIDAPPTMVQVIHRMH